MMVKCRQSFHYRELKLVASLLKFLMQSFCKNLIFGGLDTIDNFIFAFIGILTVNHRILSEVLMKLSCGKEIQYFTSHLIEGKQTIQQHHGEKE